MSERDDELGKLIRSKATRYAAPAQLRVRVGAMLEENSAIAASASRRVGPGHWSLRRWPHAGLGFVLGVLTVIVALPMMRGQSDEERVAQDVINSHVRSLMGTHLVDVVSSDKHTVKPWFAGKLDYAPIIKDLGSQGVVLLGGRLEYLEQKPVAAVVYQVNKHVVNLFAWPKSGKHALEPSVSSRRGFNIVHWTSADMEYWIVSDLNAEELRNVVKLIASSDN
jgi:anti-sigma factor RsiW